MLNFYLLQKMSQAGKYVYLIKANSQDDAFRIARENNISASYTDVIFAIESNFTPILEWDDPDYEG